ncbi:MAG: hypothetical protein WKF30_17190, partial [Pyrinomonadaceae bacterium]
ARKARFTCSVFPRATNTRPITKASASDLEARLAQHASKSGARLIAVILEAGMSFRLARTWEGTRDDERRLKNRHDSSAHLPALRRRARAREGD